MWMGHIRKTFLKTKRLELFQKFSGWTHILHWLPIALYFIEEKAANKVANMDIQNLKREKIAMVSATSHMKENSFLNFQKEKIMEVYEKKKILKSITLIQLI